MKQLTQRGFLGVGGLILAGLMLAAPEMALAGAGGAEFQGAYDMLTGWMTGILGRIIAITFIVVAPDIIDNIVTATLPIV